MQGLAFITGIGQVKMPEMIRAVDAVAEDPRFTAGCAVIFDLRGANYTADIDDGTAFVDVLRRRMAIFQGGFALVVPENLHGLARLYTVLARVGGYERMQCFLQIDEARAWCAARGATAL